MRPTALAGRAALVCALTGTALVAATTGATAGASTYAPCTPTRLPTLAGTDGEIMWMTSSRLYVGGTTNGATHPDGSSVFQAAYWTRDSAGFHVHALPGDPLVDDEVLDVNEHARMVVYGVDSGAGVNASYVFDLPSGRWWRLGSLGGNDTRGRRINIDGVVAGGGTDREGAGYAATWAPPYDTASRLPALGNYGSYAPGINDAGVTVGVVNKKRYTPAYDQTMQHLGPHAYFPFTLPVEWAANHTPTVLPTLSQQGETFAVNNGGTVVGAGDLSPTTFTWDAAWWGANGRVHDMGATPGSDLTEARGISQGGWATGGGFSFSTFHGQAFVWTGSGTLQPLPALSGPDGDSNAHGVSDMLGQIGGWSQAPDGSAPPTLWGCPAGFTTG